MGQENKNWNDEKKGIFRVYEYTRSAGPGEKILPKIYLFLPEPQSFADITPMCGNGGRGRGGRGRVGHVRAPPHRSRGRRRASRCAGC